MNEIIDTIKEIRERRKELEKQEKDIVSSICNPLHTVDFIKQKYFDAKGIESFESYDQKKMFIFICTSMICPTIRLGDRMPKKIRQKLHTATGIHPVQISYISRNVITYYSIYKDFKSEADYLYEEIKRSLMS